MDPSIPLTDPAFARFHIYDDRDIEALPPPDWLIPGVLLDRSVVVLYGDSDAYKSTLALDWTYCIASGTSWAGRLIHHPGPAFYIAAEGSEGLGPRIRAWKKRRSWSGTPLEVAYLTDALVLADLRSGDREDLPRLLAARDPYPRLIVLDTLAATFGQNEDAADRMATYLSVAYRLRAKGASVLILHHAGKRRGSGPRGSGALRAGVDTLWRLERQGDRLKLSCEKQRHAPRPDPIWLLPETVRLGRQEAQVLDPCDPPAPTDDPGRALPDQKLIHAARFLLDRPLRPMPWFEAWAADQERTTHRRPGRNTHWRLRRELIARSWVEEVDGECRLTKIGRRCSIDVPSAVEHVEHPEA